MLTTAAAAIMLRATRLAVSTAWAVAALPREPLAESLVGAARAVGLREVHCLPGAERRAFTAGLLCPRVYVCGR